MVRINSNTWITPTSYGLVFSHINSLEHLKRIYLDNEAANSLLENTSQDIIASIEEKGVTTQGLHQYITNISKEKKQCDDLASTHNWHLFSLYPLQLSIQAVSYCNANCDFCYANIPNSTKKRNMDLETVHSLKDYAAFHGVKFGVSGGEPLLHPQIYDILTYKNKEVFDTLITNLTAKFDINRLIETQVDLIQVSIHGFGSIHDEILGIPDAYTIIKKRMDILMDNVNIATNTVITPSNIHSIEPMVNDLSHLQKSHGKQLSYVRFVPVLPSGTGLKRYDTKEEFMNQVKTLLLNLQNQYQNINFEIPMLQSNPYEYYYREKRWICPAGSTVAVVRLDGHVIPCNQFLDTPVCSQDTIHQKDFHDIWLNDTLLSSMRKGISCSSENITCSECRYLVMKQNHQLFK